MNVINPRILFWKVVYGNFSRLFIVNLFFIIIGTRKIMQSRSWKFLFPSNSSTIIQYNNIINILCSCWKKIKYDLEQTLALSQKHGRQINSLIEINRFLPWQDINANERHFN